MVLLLLCLVRVKGQLFGQNAAGKMTTMLVKTKTNLMKRTNMMVIIFLFNNKLAAAGGSKLLSGWIDRIMLGGARPGNQLGGNIEDKKDKKIKR